MSFKPGDRVRWSDGKTGTVLSEPRRCDYARGARLLGLVWRSCRISRCTVLVQPLFT